jgi:tRNA A-37 threonylcarbamoyl transferase component Bud32
MSDERRACAECGGPLPADGTQCPTCLLHLGLEAREGPTVTTSTRRGSTAVSIDELRPLFPQLEILELVGEGGMGAVYRARQPKLQRLVAVKILSRELSADPAFAQRFLREGQALARLQHPNIVALHDFGEVDGYYFLVMEYADGLNLRQIMQRGDLTPREALAIVPQICDGLQYAHDAGVIHRDIKPENVLIDRNGKVKITDFGLAKIVDPDGPSHTLTGSGQIMGTPQYMAPEQLTSSRDVDHRADIYSLGVVFYELLTGNLPRGRFDLPSRRIAVDVRLDEVVLRALEQEPARRYQHVSELKTGVAVATAAEIPAGESDVASMRDARGWRSALRSFLSFTGVWVISGLAFNAGPFALAGAAMLFVIVGLVEARRRFGRARVGRFRRALATVAAAALLAISFGCFFVAEVSRWERSTADYLSSPQDPLALRQVGEDAAEEMLGRSTVVHESSDVQDAPKIYRTRYIWIAAWLALGSGMLIFPAGAGVIRPLRKLASACAPALVALAAVHGLIAIPRWFAAPVVLVPLVSTSEVSGEVSAVGDALYLSLLEAGAAVETRHLYSAGPQDSASPAFGAQLLAAQPGSPFDRWKITWKGPTRMFPYIVVMLAGSVPGTTTAVRIDAGRGSQDGDVARRWPFLVKDLLAP